MPTIMDLSDKQIIWVLLPGDTLYAKADLHFQLNPLEHKLCSQGNSYRVNRIEDSFGGDDVIIKSDSGYEFGLKAKEIRDWFELPLNVINRFPMDIPTFAKHLLEEIRRGQIMVVGKRYDVIYLTGEFESNVKCIGKGSKLYRVELPDGETIKFIRINSVKRIIHKHPAHMSKSGHLLTGTILTVGKC